MRHNSKVIEERLPLIQENVSKVSAFGKNEKCWMTRYYVILNGQNVAKGSVFIDQYELLLMCCAGINMHLFKTCIEALFLVQVKYVIRFMQNFSF